MSIKADILIITPESELRDSIRGFLSLNGFHTSACATAVEAMGQTSTNKFDLVIIDTLNKDSLDAVNQLQKGTETSKLICILDQLEDVMKLENSGVKPDGVLFKPVRESEVRYEIGRVLSHLKKSEEKTEKPQKYVHHDSRNPRMAELYNAAVSKIAKSDSTVLIVGESGTGKELMASWIYANSMRKSRPFVRVSCAVLPEGVLESELFGHEKGAFTGAYTKRKGRFELADNGTIFLDEIGDITPAIQSKFLRVLQEREFQRVGSNETISVDVRIIAATSRDLRQEVEGGHFREDLFYRLNVITIPIPPLRERKEDIPALTDMFIKKFAKKSQKDVSGIEDSAMKILVGYDWPGNVRELENAMEWSVVMTSGDIITANDLPTNIVQMLADESPMDKPLREAREEFEKDYITDTLSRFKGNVSKSSKYLGLARKNLQEKIKKYEINAGRYR